MHTFAEYIELIFISYLFGSIPFGLLFAKLLKKGDLRTQGSGNIGATNAWRVGGKLLGICTLVFDMIKGMIPILIAKILMPGLEYLAGFAAVCGHIFPIWLRFEGGKGVATTLAVIGMLNVYAGIIFISLWGTTFLVTNTSSVASLIALISTALISMIFFELNLGIMLAFLSILIVFRHKDNIKRILAGEENPILRRNK